MNPLLKIENLNVSYKSQGLVLKNINLILENGEILALVGESGGGKSTLIKSILKLLPKEAKIESGEINFENIDILKLDIKGLQSLRGSAISMIFQNAEMSMNGIRTIESQFVEYIRIHNKMITKEDAKDIAYCWLDKFKFTDIERVMKSYPFELSGGMKQRIAIAMAMSQSPKILLADEPTSALDATIQYEVIKELKKIRKDYNTSIIIVTHNIGVASYLSDRIGIMKDGEIVEIGEKEKILSNPQHEYTKILLNNTLKLK